MIYSFEILLSKLLKIPVSMSVISICDITVFFFNHSGLTTGNYSELSHIYEKYKTQGIQWQLEIVPRCIYNYCKDLWKIGTYTQLNHNWCVWLFMFNFSENVFLGMYPKTPINFKFLLFFSIFIAIKLKMEETLKFQV